MDIQLLPIKEEEGEDEAAAAAADDVAAPGKVAPHIDSDVASDDDMDEETTKRLLELVWQQRLDCFERLPFEKFFYFRAAAKNSFFRRLSFNDELLHMERLRKHPTSGYEEVKAYVSRFYEADETMQTFAADLFYVVLTTKTRQFRTMQQFLDYADPDCTPWQDFSAHMCATIFLCKGLKDAEPRQQKNVATFMKEWHDVVKAVIAANNA